MVPSKFQIGGRVRYPPDFLLRLEQLSQALKNARTDAKTTLGKYNITTAPLQPVAISYQDFQP